MHICNYQHNRLAYVHNSLRNYYCIVYTRNRYRICLRVDVYSYVFNVLCVCFIAICMLWTYMHALWSVDCLLCQTVTAWISRWQKEQLVQWPSEHMTKWLNTLVNISHAEAPWYRLNNLVGTIPGHPFLQQPNTHLTISMCMSLVMCCHNIYYTRTCVLLSHWLVSSRMFDV